MTKPWEHPCWGCPDVIQSEEAACDTCHAREKRLDFEGMCECGLNPKPEGRDTCADCAKEAGWYDGSGCSRHGVHIEATEGCVLCGSVSGDPSARERKP